MLCHNRAKPLSQVNSEYCRLASAIRDDYPVHCRFEPLTRYDIALLELRRAEPDVGGTAFVMIGFLLSTPALPTS